MVPSFAKAAKLGQPADRERGVVLVNEERKGELKVWLPTHIVTPTFVSPIQVAAFRFAPLVVSLLLLFRRPIQEFPRRAPLRLHGPMPSARL